MFNRFMNNVADRIGQAVASYLTPERVTALAKSKKYYEGDQAQPLKLKPGQANDNLIINWIGLAINRSTSMLVGGGVDFTCPNDTEGVRAGWLANAWKANKKGILLHRTALDGEVFGTWYIKILPEGKEMDGETFPRLVLLDPQLMAIETDPMDLEQVERYVFEMKIDGEDRAVREVTRRADSDGEIIRNEFNLEEPAPSGSWIVQKFESRGQNAEWILVSSKVWPYPFPPIIHCQNLPSIHSVYGVDGLSGGTDSQDKFNFVMSNILKIIRYHAHPKTWGKGIKSQSEKVSWGADEMVKFSDPEALIANLEMQSDLGSSRAVAFQDLKQSIFELARVVDIASLKDKIGALTNFALRVIYSDALSKNSTRRELYGDALEELNRRMFIVAGIEDGSNAVVWGPDLPQDEKEDAALILQDLQAAIVSKETAATKRGYQWKTDSEGNVGEEDRIANERAAGDNATNDALARLFAGNTQP